MDFDYCSIDCAGRCLNWIGCGNDSPIASADFNGVNFIAIQALEKRTTDLKSENEKLKSELSELKSKIVILESMVQKLTVKSDNTAATIKLAQK